MKLVRAQSMLDWACLKESRLLSPAEWIEWDATGESHSADSLLFVSHRWITPEHPDPNGDQLREVQQRLRSICDSGTSLDQVIVFYDYCSMLQRARTEEEDKEFYADIAQLESVSNAADRVIVLSEGYTDYKHRAWCFFEAIVSHRQIHFFPDQDEIKQDLDFMGRLLAEIKQFTSYDFSFKVHPREAEIVTAIMQHLRSCRVTHSEDFPLIENQVLRHLHSRRFSPFGRLVAAIHRFFEVSFAVVPNDGRGSDVVCQPYFSHPQWQRLPAIPSGVFNIESLTGGEQQLSIFSLDERTQQQLREDHPDGFQPVLRLQAVGVDDHAEFLQYFQNDPDWQRFIVDPIRLGEISEDCFPSVEHVVHTILETPPGFFRAHDGSALYVPLLAS